ncbi:DNA helicase PIF1, ATP-dependent, partial [Tanacetum coccineum]
QKQPVKRARKPATLSSSGIEVSYHNLGALTYECRECNATMREDRPFDTQKEIRNRMDAFIEQETCEGADGTIVGSLIKMLDQNKRTSSRQYNASTIAEVATLVINDFEDGAPTRDIIVSNKDSGPQRISELHPSYMALQYPLLFPYGEDGYRDKIPQRAHDWPEVGTRVFKLKLTELLDDLTKNQVFGETRAVVYVIKFQKCSLPHAHILLWLEEHCKCKTPHDIDDKISAELPSPTDDPVGYKAVTDYMLHGPCGKDTRYAACNV